MGAREGAGGIERAWGKVVVHSKLLTFSGGIIEMHRVGGEKMFVMKRLYHVSYASSTLPQSVPGQPSPVSFLLEL